MHTIFRTPRTLACQRYIPIGLLNRRLIFKYDHNPISPYQRKVSSRCQINVILSPSPSGQSSFSESDTPVELCWSWKSLWVVMIVKKSRSFNRVSEVFDAEIKFALGSLVHRYETYIDNDSLILCTIVSFTISASLHLTYVQSFENLFWTFEIMWSRRGCNPVDASTVLFFLSVRDTTSGSGHEKLSEHSFVR